MRIPSILSLALLALMLGAAEAKPLGKIVFVANGDTDHDGVPDFADGQTGFRDPADANPAPAAGNECQPLTPLVIDLSHVDAEDIAAGRVSVGYDASSPGGVVREGEGGRRRYLPASGSLRLWRREGGAPRDPRPLAAGGDWIAPGEPIPTDVLASTGAARMWTVYAEGIAPRTQGTVTLQVAGGDAGDVIPCAVDDAVLVDIVDLDLVADANRDGVIGTPAEEHGDDRNTLGPEGVGPIVLVNNGYPTEAGRIPLPNNWPGAIPGWRRNIMIEQYLEGSDDRYQGFIDGLWPAGSAPIGGDGQLLSSVRAGLDRLVAQGDTRIEDAGDAAQVGRVHLLRIDTADRGLPAGWRLRLRLANPDDGSDPAYFAQCGTDDPEDAVPIAAHHRVRVFMPGADGTIAVGCSELLGPWRGDHAVFVENPSPEPESNEQALALVLGSGHLELGVEGIEPGATVDLWIEALEATGTVLHRDRVRVRTAPFVLLPNSQPVLEVIARGNDAPQPTPADLAQVHADLQAFLGTQPFLLSNRYGQEGRTFGDHFPQDSFEIGAQWIPGTAGPIARHQIAVLPKQEHPCYVGSENRDLRRTHTGAFQRFARAVFGESRGYGGNIECTPPTSAHPNGMIMIGVNPEPDFDEMANDLRLFLEAQIQPLLTLDVGWLAVSHVDEVVVVVPDVVAPGWCFVVPDSRAGVAAIDDAQDLEEGLVLRLNRSAPLATIAGFRRNAWDIRGQNLGVVARRLDGVADALRSLGVARVLRVPGLFTKEFGPPALPDAGNSGRGRLINLGFDASVLEAGTVSVDLTIAFLDNRRYQITAWINGVDHVARGRIDARFPADGQTVPGSPLARGLISLLPGDWGGSFRSGDVFRWSYIAEDGIYNALCPNPVNGLVVGSSDRPRILLTDPDEMFSGNSPHDLLRSAVVSAYAAAGVDAVFSRAAYPVFHARTGEVHCGTNRFSAIPTARAWWDLVP